MRDLVALCKAGRLFAVQEWIAAGKPVNPPPHERKGARPESPLNVAIDRGFHSLVDVLLKGGARIDSEAWNGPMDRVLQLRRFDLVQLLVEHGYDIQLVDMQSVFNTWDPEIIEFFIDRGANVETGGPLANALCQRIRTGLRIFKRYQTQFPHFQKQIDVALRYHCREGNEKWVSLLLWAGADPYSPGGTTYDDCDDDEEGLSALEFAALYKHFELFRLRGIRLRSDHPALQRVLKYAATKETGLPLVERLLRAGVNPNDQENGGSSAIQSSLCTMSWSFTFDYRNGLQRNRRQIDTDAARECIKGIHVLAKRGARWCPTSSAPIADARRSLMKLIPDYTLEFVWIMSRFKACAKESIAELVRTPSMKAHLSRYGRRLHELLSTWNSDCSDVERP